MRPCLAGCQKGVSRHGRRVPGVFSVNCFCEAADLVVADQGDPPPPPGDSVAWPKSPPESSNDSTDCESNSDQPMTTTPPYVGNAYPRTCGLTCRGEIRVGVLAVVAGRTSNTSTPCRSPKGGRLRYVRLTARLAAALREHRHLRGPRVLYHDDGTPLTEGLVQGLVKRAARRAGLLNNGPHMLRHTFCTHLAMLGAPARAIQELAGHADLTTTQRYMHLSPGASDSAIRLLESPLALASRGNMVSTAGTEIAKC